MSESSSTRSRTISTAVRRDIEVADMEVRGDIRQLPFDAGRQIDQPKVLVLDFAAHHHEGATLG